MRTFLALALLIAGSSAQAERVASDAEIAKALEDRVAGAPTDCIMLRQIRSTRIIDRTAILYDMGGGLIYLNRPTSGATSLRRDLVLVTDTHSPQLCSIDVVRLYDSGSRIESGFVGLGKFVPYRRADRPR